jgi:hypothetical protein
MSAQVQLDRLRDMVNNPRRQALVMRDPAAWLRLCSCLDVLEDTRACLAAYPTDDEKHHGSTYLLAYGALQALFVQQDALEHLTKSLDIKYKRPKNLQRIREIRNDAVGHPTERFGGAYNFIIQASLKITGFDLMTVFADGRDPRFISVRIPALIAEQAEHLEACIATVIESLVDDERRHRKEFRTMKVRDTLAGMLDYHLSKVFEATRRVEMHEMGRISLKLVEDALRSFRSALVSRGIEDAYQGIADSLDDLDWPMQELEKYFRHDSASSLNDKSAYIFAHFCRDRVGVLREAADQIDRDYQQDP